MALLHLSDAIRNAACNAVVDAIDDGGQGTIEIYGGTGVLPLSPDDPVPAWAELLATLQFAAPAFGPATAGTATADTISPVLAIADGTASWARVKDGNGIALMDVDVSDTSATLILNTVTIVTGATVAISSASITMPSGA